MNEHGLTFIGPKPQHISEMGDKVSARTAMQKLGIPLVPGSDGAIKNLEELKIVAKKFGYNPNRIVAKKGGKVKHKRKK